MRASMLLTLGVLLLIPTGARAQIQAPGANVVDDFIEPGWFGVSTEEITSWPVRFVAEGSAFHVTTGAVTAVYFHVPRTPEAPLLEVTGNYTVRATFRERFTAASENPQPYGLAIGGDPANRLGATSYLYCAAQANGTFAVGGSGPDLKPFRMNGANPVPHLAVHRASADGADVTQEIVLSVGAGHITCAINGAVVASYEHDAVVGPARLESTDGLYGVYVGRNMDVEVTGLTVTTP
jgi:hypothetical protein